MSNPTRRHRQNEGFARDDFHIDFARDAGANAQQLQRIAAESLAEMYFRDNNTRDHGLGVGFTDVEHIQMEL